VGSSRRSVSRGHSHRQTDAEKTSPPKKQSLSGRVSKKRGPKTPWERLEDGGWRTRRFEKDGPIMALPARRGAQIAVRTSKKRRGGDRKVREKKGSLPYGLWEGSGKQGEKQRSRGVRNRTPERRKILLMHQKKEKVVGHENRASQRMSTTSGESTGKRNGDSLRCTKEGQQGHKCEL